jgi:hypothetical protein
MSVTDAVKARAEAAFKRKEEQARDGAEAWAEYEAKSRTIAENTKRLRALRLAKEAAAITEVQAKAVQTPANFPPPPQPTPATKRRRRGGSARLNP